MKELENQEFIRADTSLLRAPILLIVKNDGSKKLGIDYEDWT